MGSGIKRVAILGSTGSIGQQTLEVIGAFPERFCVVGLAAGKNTSLLAEQIRQFRPRFVFCRSEGALASLIGGDCQRLELAEIAGHPDVDIVVIATSGRVGLGPTLAAVKAGKDIALANKESLVMAGEIITGEARLHGARIRPVDSEHSAIWQCLEGETPSVSRLVLTASGGPFRHYTPAQLEKVTAEQALGHPTWRMGKKVTVDSATLMNKGLEVIEAHWLFNVPFENIEVVIHPQSIVHSMVEFIDGSIKAQLGCPDMRLPIQYALSYPGRLANPELPRLEWSRLSQLTFEQPDLDTFPCLRLAIEAGKRGGTWPAVVCAADEVAVELLLSRRIKFTDVARLVEQALEKHRAVAHPALDDIMAADAWARAQVRQLAKGVVR
jgi:1-deoxy-D-xylulose-5-phosphate reductoisomerase